MDMLLLLVAALAFAWAKKKDQSERIALLGSAFSRFDIEKLSEQFAAFAAEFATQDAVAARDAYLRLVGSPT